MRRRLIGQGLVWGGFVLAVVALTPEVAHAQLFRHSAEACCPLCTLPTATCTCTTLEPVVENCVRPERCVTYRNVTRSACRTEAQCETVPVTQVQNVTRDEGCYQMVWVPKPVTRQVASTTYQQRIRYRQVPYQFTERVPQVSTRMVPYQSIRYVPRTVQYQVPVCPPLAPCGPTNACPTPQAPTFAPQTLPPGAATPVLPSVPQTTPEGTGTFTAPTPDPGFLDTPDSEAGLTAPNRQAGWVRPIYDDSVRPASATMPATTTPANAVPKKLFRSPTAAAAWRAGRL